MAKLDIQRFIYTGHDKVTHRPVHIYVTMKPSSTGDHGRDVVFRVKAKRLSLIAYWFMIRILRYRTVKQ